jgi:hypothetical protein
MAMATSPDNVTNLTQDQLAKWLTEEFYQKIQIARVMPFMGIEGGMISYPRTPQLSVALPLGDGTTAIANQTPNVVASNATFALGELATRFKLDYSAQDRYKVPNNLDALLSAAAIRSLSYGFFRKMDASTSGVNGDFPSLRDLCIAANRFDSNNGTPLQRLWELQTAYNLVNANNGRPNAIMCNSRAWRWIVDAHQGAGLMPQYVECEWGDPQKGTTRAPQLAINGTPVYINEMVETEGEPEEAHTRIYFMVLGDSGEAGPTRGITGIIPAPLKGTMFVRRESSEPATTTSSLINVDYTWPVAIAMGSPGALAILENVNVVDYPTNPSIT